MQAGGTYRFGGFVVDIDQRALIRHGARVQLQPRTFDLLAYFVTHPGTLHTKRTLLDEVWMDAVVTENSLTRSIRQLRIALDDTAEESRYVETVPRTGYRFIADVQAGGAAPRTPPRRGRWRPANITTAVAALIAAVVVVGAGWWLWGGDADTPQSTAIAVLPFVNMSADPDNQHFSDGISEEILNELSRYPDLRVIARTSSFAFKDNAYDIPRLSTLLDVSYLLQGSVRKDGRQLRVGAQLVDAAGAQIWSGAYDRELGDVFEIQRGVAAAVVTTVAPHVSVRVDSATYPDLEAYRHYLIGREILKKRLPNFSQLAPEQFSLALAIDPDYAEAHAELAVGLAMRMGWSRDESVQRQRAQQAIDAALALKPDLARAYAAQGLLLENESPADAERVLRKALLLDPNDVDARNWLAGALGIQGRDAEALAELERAAKLDPLAPAVNTNIAMRDAARGEFAKAERRLRRLLELPYPQVYPRSMLVQLNYNTGRLVASTESAKQLVLTYLEGHGRPGCMETLGYTYARLGMWDTAHYWLDRLERERPEYPQTPLLRSGVLRLEGRHQEMLEIYRRTLASRDTKLATLATEDVAEYGVLQALTGDHEGAIATLITVADHGGWESRLGEHRANAQQALAWAYLQIGAAEQAANILDEVERIFREQRDGGWLHLSSDLMLFAQNALLAGNPDLAIERLRTAVDLGWRDYYAIDRDPRWRSIRDDPRLDALMVRVRADVDAQRLRVQQVDADNDFAARLEQMIAAQVQKG